MRTGKGVTGREPMTKPPWLRVRLSTSDNFAFVRKLASDLGIHTVCEEAICPNAPECWNRRTATFLILGDRCTRNCNFCAVKGGPQGLPDPEEPDKVSKAVRSMDLKFVVITSVTRDDLQDGGVGHFVRTLQSCRSDNPRTLIEVLIPDFGGSVEAIERLVEARPDVVGHNLETVQRLYPRVRPGADYRRSLTLFRQAGAMNRKLPLKSGLMLGLGESEQEVRAALEDLRSAGCRLLTLGQYLQPSRDHLSVERFVAPDEFARWQNIALEMGFQGVASGPLVRSSYHAEELYRKVMVRSGDLRPT